MAGVRDGKVEEEYPDYPTGSCVLVFQYDKRGNPIHVVWGIPKNASSPAVIDTAYKPNPLSWSDDYRERKK